jgi:hypothetical protein
MSGEVRESITIRAVPMTMGEVVAKLKKLKDEVAILMAYKRNLKQNERYASTVVTPYNLEKRKIYNKMYYYSMRVKNQPDNVKYCARLKQWQDAYEECKERKKLEDASTSSSESLPGPEGSIVSLEATVSY